MLRVRGTAHWYSLHIKQQNILKYTEMLPSIPVSTSLNLGISRLSCLSFLHLAYLPLHKEVLGKEMSQNSKVLYFQNKTQRWIPWRRLSKLNWKLIISSRLFSLNGNDALKNGGFQGQKSWLRCLICKGAAGQNKAKAKFCAIIHTFCTHYVQIHMPIQPSPEVTLQAPLCLHRGSIDYRVMPLN